MVIRRRRPGYFFSTAAFGGIYAVESSTVPILILEFDETGTIVVSGSI